MIWQDFALPLVLFTAATIAVVAMQTAWSRRQTPGARPFAYMLMAVVIWTFAAALDLLSDSFYLKVFWTQIQALGATFLPVSWFLFALEYSQFPLRESTRRIIRPVLGATAVLILFSLVTNPWHGFVWKDIRVINEAPLLAIEYVPGPALWVFIGYGYFLLLTGTLILSWSIIRFPKTYRRQGIVLILGIMLPWLVHIAQLVGFPSPATVDYTPVAFIFTGVLYSLELYRYHLFALVPIAQDTVVEAMSEGVMVVDNNDNIVYINPAARQMLNRNASLTASTDHEPEFWLAVRKLLHQSEEVNSQNNSLFVHLNDAEARYVELRTDPLFRNRSRLPGRLVLIRDVTMARDAEEQIRFQSVALASAPNPIIITDRNGIIQWVNPAFTLMTGYTSEDVLGKTPSVLKSGKHEQVFYQKLWDTILSGEIWYGEIVNRYKDGNLYIEETTIAPVLDDLGEITHFIAIKQNVTQRKELEKMRDDLMQAIVHDLRNPINSILFSLDMIQGLPLARQIPTELLSMIELSRENAWRMLGMINSMLDLSRLESGSMPLILEPVILAEMVEQTIHSQTFIAQRREILILNNVSYDLPKVNIDRLLISRVLQNLLDNAIKFTVQGGYIEITAECNFYATPKISQNSANGVLPTDELGGSHTKDVSGKNAEAQPSWVIISIHDDGPGIPTELRNLLFQKFTTGTSPRRGSGLGLAFCRLAVEAHEGRIWVESEEGRGTTFYFSLPIELRTANHTHENTAGQILETNAGP